MPRFKVGDRVRLKLDDQRRGDFVADLESCLRERDITGRVFDRLLTSVYIPRRIWIVESVETHEQDTATYELRVRTTKTPFMVDENDLEAA